MLQFNQSVAPQWQLLYRIKGKGGYGGVEMSEYECPFCGRVDLNIVTKTIVKTYTTWDCKCGAHGTIKKNGLSPRIPTFS